MVDVRGLLVNFVVKGKKVLGLVLDDVLVPLNDLGGAELPVDGANDGLSVKGGRGTQGKLTRSPT